MSGWIWAVLPEADASTVDKQSANKQSNTDNLAIIKFAKGMFVRKSKIDFSGKSDNRELVKSIADALIVVNGFLGDRFGSQAIGSQKGENPENL